MSLSQKQKFVSYILQIAIPTASQLDSSTIRQLQQLQQFLIRQTGTESSSCGGPSAGPSSSSLASTANQDSIKFNKKLLDYDYGEDEDDDHKQLTPRGSTNNNVEVTKLLFFFRNSSL